MRRLMLAAWAAGLLLELAVVVTGSDTLNILATMALAFALGLFLALRAVDRSLHHLHLQPGDVVIVEIKGGIGPQRLQEILEHTRSCFPGHKVIATGRGVYISRHRPPGPPAATRCTCDITERAWCPIHGSPDAATRRLHVIADQPTTVLADNGTIAAARHFIGPNRILLVPNDIGHWPTSAHQDADLVLTDEQVLKDRQAIAPRPASDSERAFFQAYSRRHAPVLIDARHGALTEEPPDTDYLETRG